MRGRSGACWGTDTGRPGAGVGRRVVAWRRRGVGRGLWRARCFALLQVTAGRAWPQRRRAGHWHGTGASQGRALSLARGGDGANESSSARRAGQGAGAGRGGGVVRGCGRAPVPLVFRAARWRRSGRGQQRRTSTGGRWRWRWLWAAAWCMVVDVRLCYWYVALLGGVGCRCGAWT